MTWKYNRRKTLFDIPWMYTFKIQMNKQRLSSGCSVQSQLRFYINCEERNSESCAEEMLHVLSRLKCAELLLIQADPNGQKMYDGMNAILEFFQLKTQKIFQI